MRKTLFLILWAVCCFAVSAQTLDASTPLVATARVTPAAERVRIHDERMKLELGFSRESKTCYQKFLVNNCLDEIKLRRRDALADLSRQEIALNALDRKTKGAEQVKKTEEKSSPEKQQQDAERRAAALQEFQTRMDRDKQKNADRADARTNEQSNSEALAKRIKGNQDKTVARTSKQAASADEVRKFNERQANAKERQAQHERDQINQPKSARSLPLP